MVNVKIHFTVEVEEIKNLQFKLKGSIRAAIYCRVANNTGGALLKQEWSL